MVVDDLLHAILRIADDVEEFMVEKVRVALLALRYRVEHIPTLADSFLAFTFFYAK